MKTTIQTFFIAIILFAYLSSFSQATGKFNYQAVIRSGDTALPNAPLILRFQLWDQLVAGNQLYQEDFATTTNGFGVVNLQIGTNPTLGNLSSLNWGAGSFFVDILISQSGGSFNEISSNRTQLVSVPYALYANKADTATVALNAPQTTYSAGQGITINNNTIAVSDTTPQMLSISGDSLSITNGNTVVLPTAIAPTYQIFSNTGNGTYATPPGVLYIQVEMLGGGGGGEGSNGSYPGGGGGAGGYLKFIINNPSATYSYTVGGGGAGGSANSLSSGTNGSSTVFDSNIAGGGQGSSGSSGGPGGTNSFFNGTALVNMQGNGGGGQSLDYFYVTGAFGGTGFFGGGPNTSNGTAHNGGNGAANSGSGGAGGSGSGTDGSGGAGGNGGSGTIIVTEYYK